MATSLVLAILALGFLIVVHEAGHYFVARWCGMRVERFSIGFGPGILKRRSRKTGTIFQLAPIPFGGFVEIRGMNIAEEVDPDDAQAYPNRPAWQRFVTIFAGPATNYISAIVLAMGLYVCHGVNKTEQHVHVDALITDKDYEAVGKLQPEDRIVAVDGEPLIYGEGTNLTERVTSKQGAPVKLTISRGEQKLDVEITPKPCKENNGELRRDKSGKQIYCLGIAQSANVLTDVGVAEAAWYALKYPVEQTKTIFAGLYGIIVGTEKADPGGPKRIIEEFQKEFNRGWLYGYQLLMVLSVYLGLFNLFPLPALDGGRLVFLGYEMVTRRRANPKIEATVHMSGIMLLMIVMVLVTLHDFHVI